MVLADDSDSDSEYLRCEALGNLGKQDRWPIFAKEHKVIIAKERTFGRRYNNMRRKLPNLAINPKRLPQWDSSAPPRRDRLQELIDLAKDRTLLFRKRSSLSKKLLRSEGSGKSQHYSCLPALPILPPLSSSIVRH